MILGLQAIREEVARDGTEVDKECLAYVLDMEAGSSDTAFQGGLKRDCDKDGCVLPSRLTAEGRGMRFSDFVAHEDAVLAGLSEAHVAALRIYSTAAFKAINGPLRQRWADRPHPLPVTVAFLGEAIFKLRAVGATEAEANARATSGRSSASNADTSASRSAAGSETGGGSSGYEDAQ